MDHPDGRRASRDSAVAIMRAAAAFAVIGLLLTLHLAIPVAYAETTVATTNGPLRVITTPVVPFVLPNTDPLAGFSIDLWEEVARRLHVSFTLKVVVADDRLPSLERGEADVAIGLIVMTPDGEKHVDFSHPYFDSGLQIMVRSQHESRFIEAFQSIPWAAILEPFGVTILIMLLLAHVLWLIERRNNPSFRKKYLPAIGEGLWGATLIIATGEQ